LCQLVFNIFGYFLAPNVSGFLMDQFEDKREGQIIGIRFTLGINIFSIIFIVLAFLASARHF
jgi:hypothetical protein